LRDYKGRKLNEMLLVWKFCTRKYNWILLNEKMEYVAEKNNLRKYCTGEEPGSSVSIVPGHGLDDQAIEVRSPAEARESFL
jgi:hypothetical protein